MKTAVLCEFSGIVRDAFLAAGHDAISCDLEPSESPGPHIQGDCRNYDWSGYDLIIAHPPCTYLSYAGRAWWDRPGRSEKRKKAMEFFMYIYNLSVEKICIENPMGYPRKVFRKEDQKIQPYFFGDPQQKTTCLWLRGLPPLIHAEQDELFFSKTHTEKPAPNYIDKSGKKRYGIDSISIGGFNSKETKKARSRFFPGIAAAMAAQWGG